VEKDDDLKMFHQLSKILRAKKKPCLRIAENTCKIFSGKTWKN